MAAILLIIIYLAFISLGLPDALLGSAWPVMYLDFGVSQSFAGVITFVISGGTIISSFLSGKLIKMGTGRLTFISVLLTACALLAISFVPSALILLIFAFPLGLGAGAVDSGLNNYISQHYKSYHMSWLHCFWGVGATVGPFIISSFLSSGGSWRGGYSTVSIVQFSLAAVLLLSLPLWKRVEKTIDIRLEADKESEDNVKPLNGAKSIAIVLSSFLFYCAMEYTLGLWGASYLVNIRGIVPASAALYISCYYGSITGGRFLSGFLTLKFSNKALIRGGIILAAIGAVLIALPLPGAFALAGFIAAGLGCAPVYPCMLHETPRRFGRETAKRVMGWQMGTAYLGGTIMPLLFGFAAGGAGFIIFPFTVMGFALVMLFATEAVNIYMKKRQNVQINA